MTEQSFENYACPPSSALKIDAFNSYMSGARLGLIMDPVIKIRLEFIDEFRMGVLHGGYWCYLVWCLL